MPRGSFAGSAGHNVLMARQDRPAQARSYTFLVSSPLIVPALLIAAVLLLSAVAKLVEPQATSDAFTSLRLPSMLARTGMPRLLPWAEIALALALLLTPSPLSRIVAVLAVLLMAAYTGVIARALRFEHPVDCSCFGKLGAGRVTQRTLVRNLLLTATAVLAWLSASRTEDSVLGQLLDGSARTWGWLAMTVLTGALAWLIVDRGAEPGRHVATTPTAEAADDDEYVRLPIPFGALEEPEGNVIGLRTIAQYHAVLLAFLNESCGPCVRAQSLLAGFDEANPEIAVRSVYREYANREAIPSDVPWYVDPAGQTGAALGAMSTPSAVLLGADGLIAGGPVHGEEAFTQFLTDISEELQQAREEAAALQALQPAETDAISG